MGLKIAIDYKKGTDVESLMNRIYKNTRLEDSFGCNFNVLVDGKPEVMGVTQILDAWLKWRRACVNRTLQFEHEHKSKKLMLLNGLQKISLNINKAVKIIMGSSDSEVVPNLMKGFKINEEQAEFIAEIKLRNLNKDYILERTKEISSLEKRIEELSSARNNDKKLNSIIVKQLEDIIKKYGEPRKTGIINADEVTYEEEPPKESSTAVKVVITKKGYLKLVNPAVGISDIKVQDEDEILLCEETTTGAELLLFSSMQNVYKSKLSSFKLSKPSDIGEYAPGTIGFAQGEDIKGVIVTSNFEGNAVLCFENGKIARVPLSAYETKTNRKKLVNSISSVSSLVAAFKETKHEIQIITSNDRGISLSSELIPEKTTKNTQGVQAVRLEKNEIVTDAFSEGNSSYITKKAATIPVAPKPLKSV